MDKNEKAKILRLKEVMQELGWSREKLAQAVEVSVTSISNINSGLHLPSIETLVKIAMVMDVDVRELFHPTKKGSVSLVEVNAAKDHLLKALKSLEGDVNG